jgi:Tfp pilus assembly protein PilN
VSQVNLLPPELKQRQATRRTTSIALVAGAAALALVVLFSFLKSAELSHTQDELRAQQAVNQHVQAQIAELQKYSQLGSQLQAKQQLVSSVFANEVSWSGVLLDLSRVVPADAYLTQFSGQIAPPTTTGTTTPSTPLIGSLTFTGNVKGADTLAAWLTRLEQVKGWVNAWANSASESAPFSRIYQFNSGVDLSPDVVTRRGQGATTP